MHLQSHPLFGLLPSINAWPEMQEHIRVKFPLSKHWLFSPVQGKATHGSVSIYNVALLSGLINYMFEHMKQECSIRFKPNII